MASLILVEGLIGAGKSTFCESLGAALGYRVMYEPVKENPYLEKFYEDPKRWALEMQYWLMANRFRLHQEAVEHIWKTGQSVLQDRSIYGDTVFCKLNFQNGNIDRIGYESYCHMRDVMTRHLLVPQVTIYLDTKPEVCAERILSRGRDCEKEIPLSYLRGLDFEYSDLLQQLAKMGSTIMPLDWNQFQSTEQVITRLRGYLPQVFKSYEPLEYLPKEEPYL
jgi:deoxyadenosine/deoxycytidine kinase